jgi:uncharacterized protein with HEPN domain
MNNADLVRLQHMRDAAQKAVAFMQDRRRTELDDNEMLRLALVRLLEILGEAAKNVTPEVREANKQIPWKSIAGTRDRLIHGYFKVDLDVVWEIITVDLPPLIVELEQIISPEV